MFDSILTEIQETRDRQAVMLLLQGIDVPLAVLTIRAQSVTGRLWIANGKYLSYAKVLPDGEGGLIDMLRLLAIKEGEFSLEINQVDAPPKLGVQIALSELVADEHAVARKIKNVLWPVSELEADDDEPAVDMQPAEAEAPAGSALDVTPGSVVDAPADGSADGSSNATADNVVAQEATTTKKKKKSKNKKQQQQEEDLEVTKVRLSASDAALAAMKKDGGAARQAAENDDEVKQKSDDQSSAAVPAEREELAEQAVEKAETEPESGKAAGEDTESAFAPAPAELGSEDTESVFALAPVELGEELTVQAAPAQADKTHEDTESGAALAAGDKADEDAKSPAGLMFAKMTGEETEQVPALAPAELGGDETEQVPALRLGEITGEAGQAPAAIAPSAPADRHQLLESLLNDNDSAGALSSVARDDQKLAEAKVSERTIDAEDQGTPEFGVARSPEIIESDSQADKLSHKRRAEYEAMNSLLGEEPAKFYEEGKAYSQMSEEKLDQQRRAEMLALSKMLSENLDEFSSKPQISDDEATDELKTKRQADYEALKLFYAEEPEKFMEAVGLAEKLGPTGLSDFQRRILEIASEEAEGEQVFSEVDGQLADTGSLRPSWEPPPLPTAEEPVPEPPDMGEVVAAPAAESPYVDAASSVSRNEKLRSKLPLGPEHQSTELLDRRLESGRTVFASSPESLFRRQPLNPKVIAAVVLVVIVMPLAALTVWHFFDAQAQEDLAMQRESALLAQRSIEQTSVVEKPQEAFRLPAGSTGNATPPVAHDDPAITAPPAADPNRDAHHEWHAPANPQPPITADQMADANNEMQKADSFLQAGLGDRAISIYVPLVRKYPNYVQLRIKAARAYLAMRQYRQAYEVCSSGLDSCQTRGDFDMLVNVMREIP